MAGRRRSAARRAMTLRSQIRGWHGGQLVLLECVAATGCGRRRPSAASVVIGTPYLYNDAAATDIRLSEERTSYKRSSAGISGSCFAISYPSAIAYSENAIS